MQIRALPANHKTDENSLFSSTTTARLQCIFADQGRDPTFYTPVPGSSQHPVDKSTTCLNHPTLSWMKMYQYAI
jgi:hypothetical protein